MTLPIELRLEAVADVDAAYAWYEKQRAGLGEEFLSAFLEKLDLICDNPEAWALLFRKIRACTMERFPYVIYFRNLSDRVDIVAVQHGSRHPRNWRRRA